MTNDEITFEINPVWLELASPRERWGQFNLMRHQVACRDIQRPNLTLMNAPPSGGKTLASLTRVMRRFEDDKSTHGAIFIYPTNSLLEDQAESIRKRLVEKNYSVTVLDGERPLPERLPSSDLRLLVVNGNTLDAYIGEGFSRKGDALIKLLSGYQHTIMLTNPDTVALIFKGSYHRPSTLMREFLKTFEGCTLVLDEFHLYYGAALAWILYLTWLLRHQIDDLIISSATLTYRPADFQSLYRDRLLHYIQAKAGQEGHEARKRIDLTLVAGNPPSKPSDAEFFLEKTSKLYDETHKPASHGEISLLVLVDSVAFCDYLAKRLTEVYSEEKVGVIHGFVPSQARKDALQRDIVVGTRAVELGIDFDVSALLFEASDSASFIQRLGRAGRHKEAKVVGVIDKYTLSQLKELNGLTVDHARLEEEISRIMVNPRHYLGFIKSREALRLYLSIHYSYFERMPSGHAQANIERFISEKKRANRLDEVIPFPEQESHIDRVLATPIPLFEALRRCFLRGYDAGIPAYYLQYDSFSRVDLFDIPRFEVEYLDNLGDLEAHLRRPVEPPAWLGRNEGIVLLKALRPQRILVSGRWLHSKGLLVLEAGKNFNLDPSVTFDERLREALENSINKAIAWTTTSRPDWRFQSLRGFFRSTGLEERGHVVIGLDALVQRTIDEERSNRD